jgi:hypothetical protein
MKPNIIADYVNARIDIARKDKRPGNIDAGKLAVEGPKTISKNIKRYCGKPILRAIRQEYQSRQKRNLASIAVSEHIIDPLLQGIAKRVFKAGH